MAGTMLDNFKESGNLFFFYKFINTVCKKVKKKNCVILRFSVGFLHQLLYSKINHLQRLLQILRKLA